MADLPKNPINRKEKYLNAIATGDASGLPSPITREEVYLDYIARNGGGGGGAGDVKGVKGDAETTYRKGNVNLTPANLGIETATVSKAGLVMPDNETIEIDAAGKLSVKSGSGDATLASDVTSNLEVGAIPSGTTVAEGTTFTEFVQKLLITEIAPTISFTASGSGVKEVGTSVTPTYTLNITDAGTGTPVSIEFYRGSTLVDTQPYVAGASSYSYTDSAITSTITVRGVLNYTKSDSTTPATVDKSAAYTFVMASYYGAVNAAPTTQSEITALTKNVKTGKGQTATFNLSNQRSCYAYPASMGNLTSIKDANNFEYIGSYTKTAVTVDGTAYNVYTLTDPVTAAGFQQVYA